MTDFVSYDTAQNNSRLEVGIVTLGETHCIVVVDTGKNRMDGKTKDRVLELVPDGCRKYPQPDVGSFGCSLTGSLRASGGQPHWTFQPDCPHASVPKDSAGFAFGLR